MPRLSKSQFIRGLQCYKSLWLYQNKPELREEPDAAKQAVFDSGTEVGKLAQKLFPEGTEIHFAPDRIAENIQRTAELLDAGIETIYEAAFRFNDVLVLVDILHKDARGWHIYEVKSSTEMKEVHVNDVAIQYYVLTGCGLAIESASVIHINNQYIRQGDLDIQELFVIADVTEDILSCQDYIRDELSSMKEMLQDHMPEIDIGTHCSSPYDCDFHNHCWQHIPKPSVFDLTRLWGSRKFELYYKGVLAFEDIPDEYRLSPAQIMQIQAEHDNRRFINERNIAAFLDTFTEPIGFLDFETYQEPVPDFNNQRPYQQIPFQYSLHIIENGELIHFEYLAPAGIDPRREFIERLIEVTERCSTILVYNQGFENGRMRELAGLYPEYACDIAAIIARVVDLMKPFQAKDYYTKEMKGSYSIKKVLPALVPELGYDDLEISNGGMAMQAFANLQHMDDETEIACLRANLLKYCEMDTLAMVKIWEHLTIIASE